MCVWTSRGYFGIFWLLRRTCLLISPSERGCLVHFSHGGKKETECEQRKKNERKKKKETYALISDGESRDKQCITAAFERRTTINQAQPHMKVVAATFVFSTHQKQQKPIK